MVNETWIKEKIVQLETDRSNGPWSEIRELQITYDSWSFAQYSHDTIAEKLVQIFYGI
ncbi:MAG TPA: hypothetical protein VMT57_01910 [Candidatus Thermoplasmatota archaeon]|nr:hypothetical protein [Candidatus Thermoplasmatota archaeon]